MFSQLAVDEHTHLRPFEVADAEAAFGLVDANRPHLRRWLPWVDTATSVEDTRAFFKSSQEQGDARTNLYVGIWHRGELAGSISFYWIDTHNRCAAIAYVLAERFQGRGLVTKACRTLVSYGFTEVGLNRLEIRAAAENTRSRAVAERLGFTVEGIARQEQRLQDRYVDMVVYPMLAPEWRAASGRTEGVLGRVETAGGKHG
ncbi:MAG: GNAT family N-acetyltransferase [SAR202 cluster bacterium]|nr:GNAT family N-acetyltransferase [SAR202 cluster bacterium]